MQLNTNMLKSHLRRNITVYVFMTTLFLTGIIFGAIIVNSMTFIQKEALFFHVDRFFSLVSNDSESIVSKDIFKSSFLFHLKYISLFFLLGLTIIGLPVLWILLFIKGLVIGFSVGFIVNQLGMKGLLIATLSIAPQNIITIPVYIIASSLAMIFSLILIQKLFVRTASQTISRPFVHYISAFVILLVFVFLSSLIETFVASEAFKAFLKSSYFIN